MKKKRSVPVQVEGYTLDRMLARVQDKAHEAEEFVKRTGLCIVCKKTKVVYPVLECPACQAETERLLSQLRGPGFMEFRVPPRRP